MFCLSFLTTGTPVSMHCRTPGPCSISSSVSEYHQGPPWSLADQGPQAASLQLPLTAGSPAAHADPAATHAWLPLAHCSPPAAAPCNASPLLGWSTLNLPEPNLPLSASFCDFARKCSGLGTAASQRCVPSSQSPLLQGHFGGTLTVARMRARVGRGRGGS